MTTPVLSVSDGPRTTVADLIGAPLMIPARVLDILANQFLSQTLLRNAGRNTNGLVSYSSSTPLYLDGDVESVAEFSEIPVTAGQIGLPRIAYGIKKGLGIRISREMRDENNMGLVDLQIRQLANTHIRADERALRAVLDDPAIPTIAATAAWDSGATAKIRRDVARAKEVIASARPAGQPTDSRFGFRANTMVMPGDIEPVLEGNEEFNRVYRDGQSAENIEYTGKLPTMIAGLTPLTSYSFATNKVLVLERGTVGFYSDTRPLEATGLYPEGGGPNGGPTESWRSDSTRKRVMGADQPLAACWITGVRA